MIKRPWAGIACLLIGACIPASAQYTYNYYYPPAPSSTPWAPAWSPDGKKITVSMQGSLWNIDPATGRAEELASDGRYCQRSSENVVF